MRRKDVMKGLIMIIGIALICFNSHGCASVNCGEGWGKQGMWASGAHFKASVRCAFRDFKSCLTPEEQKLSEQEGWWGCSDVRTSK